MNWPDLIRHYGWLAIAVGTFFEGEWVMLAAGVGVRAGWLSPWTLVAAGMGGTFASDFLCFWGGRLAGRALVRRWPSLGPRLRPVERLVERHSTLLVILYQFFPGLCTVTPLAYGMSRIPALKFVALNCVGIVLWTASFASGGYGCATLVMTGHAAWLVIPALAAVGFGIWSWKRMRREHSRGDEPLSGSPEASSQGVISMESPT